MVSLCISMLIVLPTWGQRMHRHEQGVHGAAPSHAARPSISISLFCFHYSQVCSLLYCKMSQLCCSAAVLFVKWRHSVPNVQVWSSQNNVKTKQFLFYLMYCCVFYIPSTEYFYSCIVVVTLEWFQTLCHSSLSRVIRKRDGSSLC